MLERRKKGADSTELHEPLIVHERKHVKGGLRGQLH